VFFYKKMLTGAGPCDIVFKRDKISGLFFMLKKSSGGSRYAY